MRSRSSLKLRSCDVVNVLQLIVRLSGIVAGGGLIVCVGEIEKKRAGRTGKSCTDLHQVYLLKVEGIAFRFLPDPVQIKNALEFGCLEDVMLKMEISEKNSGWEDLIFIPPEKAIPNLSRK